MGKRKLAGVVGGGRKLLKLKPHLRKMWGNENKQRVVKNSSHGIMLNIFYLNLIKDRPRIKYVEVIEEFEFAFGHFFGSLNLQTITKMKEQLVKKGLIEYGDNKKDKIITKKGLKLLNGEKSTVRKELFSHPYAKPRKDV